MNKPSPTVARVVSSQKLTANMQRIALQSDKFTDYPNDCEGGYVKLLFNKRGGTDIESGSTERPVMRTYTIRKYDPNAATIEIDFVRHTHAEKNELADEGGFASRWAETAKPGDSILVAGPGLIQGLNQNADWYFLVADMTALPAMSVKLKILEADAKGYAIVEVLSEYDIQQLEHPEGIDVEWLIKPHGETSRLVETAKSKEWMSGSVSVWSASEFDSMRSLRQYFRNERSVDREYIYISSYWKKGVTEDGHKVLKSQDAQEQQK
ncbi:siderophore-interacting protein [Vibrio hannami]|uniref:siderophore-interacting protein n=1 Tax=Vibrio hannami TaxID=2717094 RepID=UPI00240FCA4C|nr:siderophore-interacting protein [Vibrio hannami]MDG3085632.1 siderophore-interacting protein [Vibrio hannami]